MRNIKFAVTAVFTLTALAILLTKGGAVSGQGGNGLTAPSGVTATDNIHNNKVGIYWDAVRGATIYRIFRSSVNNPANAVDIGTTPLNFFFDQGAAPGQTLFYWVRAENGGTISELSVSDQGIRSGTAQQGPVPPLEPPPPGPAANPTTATKATLGKVLFWDEQLSSTRTVACGTCHTSGFGGTDPRSPVSAATSTNPGPDSLLGTPDDIRGSAGVPFTQPDGTYVFGQPYGLDAQVTGRRSMSYINAAYSPILFWDGRATGVFRDPISNLVVLNAGGALESQSVGPPVSSAEMAHSGRDWNDVAARIAASKPLALSANIPGPLALWIGGRNYPELFQEAFGTPDVTPSRIALAIGSFERTLFSDQAPIDLANAGIATLTAAENRGRNIFNANGCNTCHGGNLFTDNNFHYIGVRPQSDDTGRFQVTNNPGNLGEFRTPSLRNVELRRSYFHNGQFTTLEQVVAFYNRGGDFNAPNKPPVIRPLGLNAGQQADLVAFLRRPLTDPRVAAESGPFSRPQLYTESNRVPQVSGTGRSGSGGFMPQIKAITPPIAGNPNFTISVAGAMGNAPAYLVVDAVDPGVGNSIPITGSLGKIAATTSNTGAGNGWASVLVPLPATTAVIGRTFFARWYVQDAGAPGGFAVSPVAQFTVFGDGVEASTVTISGQVLTPDGRGLGNARVVLADPMGSRRAVTTSTFGYYTFDNVYTGINYSLGVSSRIYRFDSINITVTTDLTNVIFTGQQ